MKMFMSHDNTKAKQNNSATERTESSATIAAVGGCPVAC